MRHARGKNSAEPARRKIGVHEMVLLTRGPCDRRDQFARPNSPQPIERLTRSAIDTPSSAAHYQFAVVIESRVSLALIRLRSGHVRRAELHWYEAHGIGRKEIKRRRYLD